MKSFTHFFRLITPAMVASQWKQHLTLDDEASPLALMATDPVVFSQDLGSGDEGIYYTMNFSAVVKDKAVMAFNRRHVIVEITLSDGSIRYVGTSADPVLLNITPYTDRYSVSFEYLSVDPIIF